MPNDRLNHSFPAPDGEGQIGALLERPASGMGPGLVLAQEIFGVSDYLRWSAERLAALGYVVLVPDLYWRIDPAADIDDRDLDGAVSRMQQLDPVTAVGDLVAAFGHLRGHDGVSGVEGVTGGAGLFGFCLGGALAYHAAAAVDPDVCVSYYGSAIPDALDRMADITCPTLFHFGDSDEYCPVERVEQVQEAASEHPLATFVLHPGGGHAFDNAFSDRFHQPRQACMAWGITAQFLERHLPPTPPA